MVDFLKLIDRKKAIAIFVLGIISGLTSFLLLAYINLMIEHILQKKDVFDFKYIILFCSLIFVFIWCRKTLSYIIIKFSQQTFWKLRSEVLQTILKANFQDFNKRKDQIHTVLINDISALTNFSLSIIHFLSAFLMTIGCFVYMGMQSKVLLGITFCVSVFGILFYWAGTYYNKRNVKLSRELENKFMKSFLDILDGFKEIHMNPKIGRDIFDRKIWKISNESYANNTKAYTSFLNMEITGEVLFYALIAFILIFNSLFSNESPGSIVNFVFILFYLLGSINTLMHIIPTLVTAKIASKGIYNLKKDLSDDRFQTNIEKEEISKIEFEELIVSDLVFSYVVEKNNEDFAIGPLNFTIKRGEIIFIYGGNGSGKTTFINALLGISKSNSGTIRFNGTELSTTNYEEYRTLFSVVFSDFYLFEELYGFDNISESEVNDYLKMFELNEKVSFKNNSFSSINLSAGQRKRLALIISLIRSNPILVLDEWAADQDPSFRKKFYTQIIPELTSRGFSIIAITHDDTYYNVSDKLYKMEFGQLSLELSGERLKKELI